MHWQGEMMDISDAKAATEVSSGPRSRPTAADNIAGPTRSRRRSSPRSRTHPDPLTAILGSALTLEEGDRLGITEEERSS